jgi:hypothetical protein
LTLEAADCPVFEARPLPDFELLPNALDYVACTAEIEGMLAAVLPVTEAIVGAEATAVAATPTGGEKDGPFVPYVSPSCPECVPGPGMRKCAV